MWERTVTTYSIIIAKFENQIFSFARGVKVLPFESIVFLVVMVVHVESIPPFILVFLSPKGRKRSFPPHTQVEGKITVNVNGDLVSYRYISVYLPIQTHPTLGSETPLPISVNPFSSYSLTKSKIYFTFFRRKQRLRDRRKTVLDCIYLLTWTFYLFIYILSFYQNKRRLRNLFRAQRQIMTYSRLTTDLGTVL